MAALFDWASVEAPALVLRLEKMAVVLGLLWGADSLGGQMPDFVLVDRFEGHLGSEVAGQPHMEIGVGLHLAQVLREVVRKAVEREAEELELGRSERTQSWW